MEIRQFLGHPKKKKCFFFKIENSYRKLTVLTWSKQMCLFTWQICTYFVHLRIYRVLHWFSVTDWFVIFKLAQQVWVRGTDLHKTDLPPLACDSPAQSFFRLLLLSDFSWNIESLLEQYDIFWFLACPSLGATWGRNFPSCYLWLLFLFSIRNPKIPPAPLLSTLYSAVLGNLVIDWSLKFSESWTKFSSVFLNHFFSFKFPCFLFFQVQVLWR